MAPLAGLISSTSAGDAAPLRIWNVCQPAVPTCQEPPQPPFEIVIVPAGAAPPPLEQAVSAATVSAATNRAATGNAAPGSAPPVSRAAERTSRTGRTGRTTARPDR